MLSTFWNRYACSIGGVHFLWIDVALAAMARGEWPVFERRLAGGLACQARATKDDEWPQADTVDAAGTAFRYERDLISADEMTAWLERSGLSTADWVAYLNRDLLRRSWSAELDDLIDRFGPSPRELAAAAVAEGVCSGVFDTFEEAFSGRAAVAFANDRGVLTASPPALHLQAEAGRLARQHAHWLSMRPAADTCSRLARVLLLEDAFRASLVCLSSNGKLQGFVEVHQLDWIVLELDTLAFEKEHAAREAVLCMTQDGLSLHDVGALARKPVGRSRLLLEELEPELRDRLLSAQTGHVLGPLDACGRFEVTAVVSRTTPTLDDPRVAERARRALIDDAVRVASRDHVHHQEA